MSLLSLQEMIDKINKNKHITIQERKLLSSRMSGWQSRLIVVSIFETTDLINWAFHLLMIFVVLAFAKDLASLQVGFLQAINTLSLQ